MSSFLNDFLFGFHAKLWNYEGELTLALCQAKIEKISLEAALGLHIEMVKQILVDGLGVDSMNRKLFFECLDE